jgi:hypothetical protein
MKITVSRRASRARITLAGVAALIAAGAFATQSAANATGPKGPTRDVTVRVEGLKSTLLAPTTVTLTAGSVSKDGKASDSCSALSALGALQDATKGSWAGTWSKSYKQYFVTTIEGTTYSSSASYYWAIWIDDKPAQVGACDYDPAPGTTLLFFPDYDGKSKSIVAPSVLGLSAPAQALVGKPFSVLVTSYANASGKPSPASDASVSAGSAHSTTSSAGKATLQVATAGLIEIKASAPNAVRDETTICVHKLGAMCPK